MLRFYSLLITFLLNKKSIIIGKIDYLNIVLSFYYRGFCVELDCKEEQGQEIYSVWVNHQKGCVVAVPCALTRKEAIRRAKQWIDHRLS